MRFKYVKLITCLSRVSDVTVITPSQVSCYKIIESLYVIGTDLALTKSRKFLRADIATYRASIGTCLAALSSTFPVAFLEPATSQHNPYSVHGSGFAQKSLEAQGKLNCHFNRSWPYPPSFDRSFLTVPASMIPISCFRGRRST